MPITFQEAYDATNPDPKAYGLAEDADEATVKERRETAARNIAAGVAANDAYWDSRNRLESLEARATGHGSVVAPPAEGDSTGLTDAEKAAAVDTTAADSAALTAGEDPVAKLRAQVTALGGSPEA